MKVTLTSAGNPDHNQNPNQPLYGCEKNKSVEVASFVEARNACVKFIDDNDLGGGNWSGGEIINNEGKIIAHVSYNGRVWEGKSMDWKSSTIEIKL